MRFDILYSAPACFVFSIFCFFNSFVIPGIQTVTWFMAGTLWLFNYHQAVSDVLARKKRKVNYLAPRGKLFPDRKGGHDVLKNKLYNSMYYVR